MNIENKNSFGATIGGGFFAGASHGKKLSECNRCKGVVFPSQHCISGRNAIDTDLRVTLVGMLPTKERG